MSLFHPRYIYLLSVLRRQCIHLPLDWPSSCRRARRYPSNALTTASFEADSTLSELPNFSILQILREERCKDVCDQERSRIRRRVLSHISGVRICIILSVHLLYPLFSCSNKLLIFVPMLLLYQKPKFKRFVTPNRPQHYEGC